MTAGQSGSADIVTVALCPRCHTDVPEGNFCGVCGSSLAAQPGDGPQWLRPNTFGAAPSEKVMVPHFASSMFPHLPDRSRRPFRLTLVVAAVALAASVAAKLPAAGITVAALGLPLLFVLYLRASQIDRDIPRVSLALSAVAGAVLGSGWVLLTGGLVARTYNVSLGVGVALHHLLGQGVAIPAIGMLLMLVPAVAVRLTRPGTRESLDGFTIGALGALVFTAAATLTRLAPQFTTGLFAHARPVEGLIVEVVMGGVTIPVTAAAAGGLAGILLWFKPSSEHERKLRTVLALLAALVMIVHTAVGVVDIVGLPEMVMLAIHLAATVLALLALRLALQFALLHETHDPIRADQPLLCIHCEMVVPDMAFCPACGAATRASTRTSRRERRGASRPQPVAGDTDGPGATAADGLPLENYPGYALPAGTYRAHGLRRPRFGWLVGRWGTAITAVAVVLGAVALVQTPEIAHYMCPPECGRPPSGTPVTGLPKFTGPGFSVSYPSAESAYEITTYDNGVVAKYVGGDTGVMQLFSEPASGRSAQEVVQALLKNRYPDARVAYVIPNAKVGYEPGYGVFADDWPQNPTATFTRQRLMVTAAVKNDLALIAFASGPYRTFGPQSGPGLPSGANLELAADLGKYVNSFQWVQ
ncbi:zinc ribbon domain-containing protein [Mycolicibacterium sp.]|uniref:zinc ribbon domain-containing protein n=1 Tax=Mycolicibacterium sp. TaxID=2320850 RepID=UPI0028B147F0|nr:zinc ribbon domain-containing protein [Mycolicibacterium sp.]